MAKVITFSRVFPAKHPRKGQPTNFVRSIWEGLDMLNWNFDSWDERLEAEAKSYYEKKTYTPKWHTIRAGNRWKEGDWFSPRVWSDRPYGSEQIQIAPDIQLKKIWTFEHYGFTTLINGEPINSITLSEVAMNDGLSDEDFLHWFEAHPKLMKQGFKGQILCWSENISYE